MISQENYQQRIEGVLDTLLMPTKTDSEKLQESMRYAVLGGGKRVRALLVYAAGEALEVGIDLLDKPAAAIELIHAYSLIHDDLPCMDDDDLRRGKATVHIKFDEATAVLAGDALQTLAFELLSRPLHKICAVNQLKILQTLATSSGARGMVKGQMIDLYAVGETLTEEQLEIMHKHKTGALIKASVLMPTYCNNRDIDTSAEIAKREKLSQYADAIGLAFQVRDDIIDIQSDTETLGKQQGADNAANKPTYPSILGMNEAKEKLYQLHQEALSSLNDFGSEAKLLREIAEFIVKRIA